MFSLLFLGRNGTILGFRVRVWPCGRLESNLGFKTGIFGNFLCPILHGAFLVQAVVLSHLPRRLWTHGQCLAYCLIQIKIPIRCSLHSSR